MVECLLNDHVALFSRAELVTSVQVYSLRIIIHHRPRSHIFKGGALRSDLNQIRFLFSYLGRSSRILCMID